MVIDARKIFACKHQFVLLPDHIICSLCEHVRETLPYQPNGYSARQSLLFFPAPSPVVLEVAVSALG